MVGVQVTVSQERSAIDADGKLLGAEHSVGT